MYLDGLASEPTLSWVPPQTSRRRSALLRVGLGVGLAAALTAAWMLWGRGQRGPDVLVIVMDTTRADRCSFIAGGRRTTPRLEELAKESVVFADAWATAPHTGT